MIVWLYSSDLYWFLDCPRQLVYYLCNKLQINYRMEAQKLNETFIPKDILKKTQISNPNATGRPSKSCNNQGDFEKTEGNAYI